jgi:hypothetical protein
MVRDEKKNKISNIMEMAVIYILRNQPKNTVAALTVFFSLLAPVLACHLFIPR